MYENRYSYTFTPADVEQNMVMKDLYEAFFEPLKDAKAALPQPFVGVGDDFKFNPEFLAVVANGTLKPQSATVEAIPESLRAQQEETLEQLLFVEKLKSEQLDLKAMPLPQNQQVHSEIRKM